MPDDLKISGREEKFTITVTFDTLELYGVVEGSREIIVENPEDR